MSEGGIMEGNQAILEKVRASKQSAPCVSIYLKKPHSRLSEETASIALYRELSYARQLLENSFSRNEASDYLKPLLQLAKVELINEEPSMLALFRSGAATHSLRLKESAPPTTVVAENFHVRPLVKLERTVEPRSFEWALILCRRAIKEGRALTGLYQVAQALRSGKVQCLWVAEDATLWGMLNRKHGTIVLHPRQMNERDGDVLDDLAEWALDQGVEIHVLPLHQMPDQHAVIAEV
jgi:hypothetical protein